MTTLSCKSILRSSSMILTILVTLTLLEFSGSSYGGLIYPKSCQDPSDCQPDECCVLGMQRYSLPQCRKLGEEGYYCSERENILNRTLHYPNDKQIHLTNGYLLFCPCQSGLTCSQRSCQSNIRDDVSNHLLDRNLQD